MSFVWEEKHKLYLVQESIQISQKLCPHARMTSVLRSMHMQHSFSSSSPLLSVLKLQSLQEYKSAQSCVNEEKLSLKKKNKKDKIARNENQFFEWKT